MGRRRAFTHEQIGAAALQVVDRDGLAGLSMRAVAEELRTGAMTLYNYVDDRQQLEALVVDAVVSEFHIPAAAASTDWRERVISIGLAMADRVRAHPDVAPLLLTRRSMSPESLRPAEALLDVLSGAGVAGIDLLVAFRTVLATVMGVIQAEVAGPMGLRRGESRTAVLERFASLDRDEYPHLIELAQHARQSSMAREVSAALELVVAGIDAHTR
jgi:AcrR family transcriptional regulator